MLRSVDMAKTQEIMARFRPIAPKPQLPHSSPQATAAALQLRTRSCRAAKRGRAGFSPVHTAKRQRTLPPALVPRPTAYPVLPPGDDLLTLSLLPRASATQKEAPAPVERNLLRELQKPKVIVPLPMRPVGSSISVSAVVPEPPGSATSSPVARTPEEVEADVEVAALPTVVSGSNNKVRLANSAYKEMVGQPECSWLDTMGGGGGCGDGGLGLRPASKRINGEVMLDSSCLSPVAMAWNAFSCRAKIEWKRNGRKTVIDAPCDVIRLRCDSKDYLFAWKFNTNQASVTNCKA